MLESNSTQAQALSFFISAKKHKNFKNWQESIVKSNLTHLNVHFCRVTLKIENLLPKAIV